MAKLSTLSASKTHRCLIYGGPKTGKTLLAGKLSQYYKLIWIDLENGHDTLFQLPQEWKERIEIISLPDTRSYPIAIETCLKLIKGPVSICNTHGKVYCAVCKKSELDAAKSGILKAGGVMSSDVHNEYFIDLDVTNLDSDTIVVFDSLTQLSNSAISNITKGKPDDYKLDYDDWGNLGKLLDIFLSHVQQANYNCIVISHETEAETEGKKKTLVPVGGTRNFSRNIAKYFDEVVYAERKNRKHTFASSSTYASNILTGSRTGAVMEGQAEGSLLSIFKPELFASAAAPGAPVVKQAATINNTSGLTPQKLTPSTTPNQVSKPQGGVSSSTQAMLERLSKLKKS